MTPPDHVWDPAVAYVLLGEKIITSRNPNRQTDSETNYIFEQGQVRIMPVQSAIIPVIGSVVPRPSTLSQTPDFDDDAGLAQRVELFAIEQFIAKATSLMPIWRIASAMFWPCDTFAVV